MKVRDLLKMDICVDVYDNVCEELGIAFVGAVELTDEGKKVFAEPLGYDVTLTNGWQGLVYAIVDVDGDDWEDRLRKAKDLFYSLAGFCTVDEYAKWVKE